MPMRSPYAVSLTMEQRSELETLSRRVSAPYRQVLRARIVLAAAAGEPNASIARNLAVCVDTVRTWRKRFCAQGVGGLVDRPRDGRPRVFPATVVAEVKALACELPARTGVPLSRWSCPELAVQAQARGILERVSASTVRRWLAADALKPWQHRSWIFPPRPLLRPQGCPGARSLRSRVGLRASRGERFRAQRRRETRRPGTATNSLELAARDRSPDAGGS